MIARLEDDKIIVQEAATHWDIKDVLDELNPLLLSKGYEPKYFFEGTPVIGQGGFSVIIKLARPLEPGHRRLIRKLLEAHNIKVIEVEAP